MMTHTSPDHLPDRALNEAHDESINESMEHPRSPLPKLTRTGWGMLLGGALLVVGGTWGLLHLTRSTQTPDTAHLPAVTVTTQPIQASAIANTLELSGTIRAVDQATLSTRVMGRITQLSLEAGDRFRKGDVLARIDVMDISAQTHQAQSGVAQAQAEVARSEAQLNQLKSQKVEAQAALQLAQINQARMAQLQAEGAVPRSRLDEANSILDQAKARVAQTDAGIRQAQAAIAQARSAVNQAKSGVASAVVNESYGDIVAPFNGVVVQKLAYEGEMAAPGTALLKIENPDHLQLEIAVPEENLRFVHVGQSVNVRVDAANQTLNGTIQQIVPAADINSRSFLVKIPLQQSGKLISGMFGRIALPLGATQKIILVPKNTLIQRGQLQGVYVVDTRENATIAVLRWVKTGQQRNGAVEIVSGLTMGDRIITNHLEQLSDGQPVNTQP